MRKMFNSKAILITPLNVPLSALKPFPKKSQMKKEENLNRLLKILQEKEEWKLEDLCSRAKLDLNICKGTVWNYLLELDKYEMVKIKVIHNEDDNPSKRISWSNHKASKKCLTN